MQEFQTEVTTVQGSGTDLVLEYRFVSFDDPLGREKSPAFPFKEVPVTTELSFKVKRQNLAGAPVGKVKIVKAKDAKTKDGTEASVKGLQPDVAIGSWMWTFQFSVTAGDGEIQVEVLQSKIFHHDAIVQGNPPKVVVKPKDVKGPQDQPMHFDHVRIGLQLNQKVKAALKSSDPPRLALGLTQSEVTDPSSRADFKDTFNFDRDGIGGEEIAYIVNYVSERLHEGLDGVWRQQDLRRGLAPLVDQTAQAKETGDAAAILQAAEEGWARAISEILTLTSYSGPGMTLFSRHEDDITIFKRFKDANDPVCSVVYACQHLAQMGVMSRGIEFDFVDPDEKKKKQVGKVWPLNAGSFSAMVTQQIGGRWFIHINKPVDIVNTPKTAIPGTDEVLRGNLTQSLVTDPKLQNPFIAMGLTFQDPKTGLIDFQPGAIYVFANRAVQLRTDEDHPDPFEFPVNQNNPDPEQDISLAADNTEGAHIGFIIRSDRPSADVRRFQFFDTGAMGSPFRGVVPITNFAGGGNIEDTWITGTKSGHDPWHGATTLRGLGMMPPRTAEQLDVAAAHTRKARPVGLARLFVVKRGMSLTKDGLGKWIDELKDNWLVYGSPMLRMWDDGENDNFTIARLAWSMRELPGAAQLQALWLIWAPRKELASAMLDGPRTVKLKQLVENAKGLIVGKIKAKADKARAQANSSNGLLAVAREFDRQAANKAKELASISGSEFLQSAKKKQDHLFSVRDLTSDQDGGLHVSWAFSATKSSGKPSILRDLPGDVVPFDKPIVKPGVVLPDTLAAYFAREWG